MVARQKVGGMREVLRNGNGVSVWEDQELLVVDNGSGDGYIII